MTDRPIVVAVVGADGAGKSTITDAVAARMTADGVPVLRIDRWDIVASPDYPTAACLAPSVADARSCAARMSSTPRLLFLLWAATLALTDRAAGPTDGVVLLDGYWMKHAASEIAYGADPVWVEAVAAGLPPADLVVYLRLDPELALRRKGGRPVPYECGMDMSRSPSSFRRHQSTIRSVLDGWSDRYGWLVVDADQPVPSLTDRLAGAALELLAGARS
ncbi:MAG TPA: thymidylate kinase [Pseudonocardiaceae bacterium]|nr:thymidylate kinase [Pseudonocardiaceae bacterium]